MQTCSTSIHVVPVHTVATETWESCDSRPKQACRDGGR